MFKCYKIAALALTSIAQAAFANGEARQQQQIPSESSILRGEHEADATFSEYRFRDGET
jgi:hypothetical protein